MKKSSLWLGVLGALVILLTVAEAKVLINAAGATFPNPIYGKWFEEFAKTNPDEQIGKFKNKPLHFPTVLGGIVPTYNLPGVTKDLRFTPEALAGIYLGKIKK